MSTTQTVKPSLVVGQPLVGDDAYAGRNALQWWLVVVLTFAAMLGAVDRQIMALLLVPIKHDLKVSDSAISLLYGLAFSLSNVLFLLPAGYFADRFNRRNMLLLGVGVWSIMTVACGLGTSYFMMFLVRAGVGFGESVIQPTGVSMLRAALPVERRGRAFAIYAMAIMLGTAISLLLGGWLIHLLQAGKLAAVPFIGSAKPWQSVLMLFGLLGLPVLLLVAFLKEPGRPAQSIIAGGSYREALSYLYMNRRVYYPLFTFNTAAGMLSLGFGAWIVPVLIRVWHLTIPEIGLTLGLMMLAGPPIGLAVVGYLMDYASQRQGPRGPLFVGIGAIVIIAALTTSGPIMPNLSVFWMILVAIMVVSGACFPITNTVVAAITPAHILGRITGVQYILYGVFAGALSATFIALASDHLFSGPTAIAKALSLMCAIYGMVAFVAAIIAVKNLKVWYAGRLM